MKKIYDSYYNEPKNNKITDHVLFVRLGITLIVLMYCIFSMGYSAYAYYSYEITSSNNVVKSASFDIDVQADYEKIDGYYILDNRSSESLTSYSFTLNMSTSSTSKYGGFAKIFVNEIINVENNSYTYSEVIQTYYSAHIDSKEENLKLEILVPSGYIVRVSFSSEWGSCSQPSTSAINLTGKLTTSQIDSTSLEEITQEQETDTLETTNENDGNNNADSEPFLEDGDESSDTSISDEQEVDIENPLDESETDDEMDITEEQESDISENTSSEQETDIENSNTETTMNEENNEDIIVEEE